MAGDQKPAVSKIIDGYNKGMKRQTLLGATGTGKTFMMANIIQSLNKNVLVLAHNKTLAGQLYNELKTFFPNNHVEFFISYYDYYQPEAFIASRGLYIEKEAIINDEIDEMRHKTIISLVSKEPTIVVSSVSCIYGIGEEQEYVDKIFFIKKGMVIKFSSFLDRLISLNYSRSEYDLKRGTFMVKGDSIFINFTSNLKEVLKVTFFGDEIESIKMVDAVSFKALESLEYTSIFPATLFVINDSKREEAFRRIEEELGERIKYFKEVEFDEHKASLIKDITMNDLEMMRELGYCQGIENYSRHLYLRNESEPPTTLVDFFRKDFLMIIDESHVTLPQVRAMFNGDRSRKEQLVKFGYRLPSALDNRPLRFEEFNSKLDKVLYVSATPQKYEILDSEQTIEAIIRPTGLLDPIVSVRETKGQIEDIIKEIYARERKNERVLILTLTIKMAEDLAKYLKNLNIKSTFLHSEIKSLERLEIIRSLRRKEVDCLIGINLLREGLDIPEVSLICILDADKEGFLRSETSLIQIIGRASRNSSGEVIMYADKITDSMNSAIKETKRRRDLQLAYNEKYHIVPKTIIKPVPEKITMKVSAQKEKTIDYKTYEKASKLEREKILKALEEEMHAYAKEEAFEDALIIRDLIIELKGIK